MKKLTTLFFVATALFGQPEKEKLRFEVVTIKPSNARDTDFQLRGLGNPGGRFSAFNVDLRFLIGFAYGDPNPFLLGNNTEEITGLSGWASTARYDVEAQTEAGFTPTTQQMQEMFQSMLEDRFKLKIRVESQDRPIYALVVDSGGVKMRPYAPPVPGAAPPQPPAVPKGGLRFRLLRANMETVAAFLTSRADRKVVDKTGLTEFYEIDLTYAPDPLQSPQGAESDPNIPFLFTAIREQLGLRLVAETGPVDTLVVEAVQRPSEN
jgi:uncharacterized protein (TIGR03435 family)